MMRRAVGLAAAILVLSPAVVWSEDDEAAPGFSDPGWYLGLGVTFDRLANGTEIRGFRGTISNEPLTGINVKNTLGVNARVGYRLFDYLAVELDADYLPEIVTEANYNQNTIVCSGPIPAQKVCTELSNAGRAVYAENQRQTSLLLMTANVKVPLLTGRFQPFLLAGLGFYHDSSVDSPAKITDGGLGEDVPANTATYIKVTGAHVGEMNLSNSGFGFAARLGGGLDLFFTETFGMTADIAWIYPQDLKGLPIEDPSFVYTRVGLVYRFR